MFLSETEINNLASFLSVSREAFIEIYCRKIDYGLYFLVSLKEKENFDCIFLSKDGCKVYPARPVQCRTYPFWRGIAETDAEWKSEKRNCPGIGKGRLFSKKEVQSIIAENGREHPYMIFKKG